MKLCFLAGADSIHSYRWINFFADRGYEIHWISLSPLTVGKSIPGAKIYEVRPLPLKMVSLWATAVKVKRMIKQIKPDILHAHYAGTYGVIGAVSGWDPFIVTAWGSDVLLAGKDFIKRPLIQFVLNKADVITCDAEHMRAAMIGLGVNEDKIRIIYFGTDIHKFHPGERGQSLRERLGVGDSPMIISLRSLEPIYDVETLMRAIPLVLKEAPEAAFVIAGKGSQEEYLKQLARSQEGAVRTVFVGNIPNDELPLYLRSSDIYVSTSLSDAGLSASTAEAMASGLPVVISDSGENRIWVNDGENGFIFAIKDYKMLAEKIVSLVRDNHRRATFGKFSREIIEERNDYNREMEKMGNIYEEHSKH